MLQTKETDKRTGRRRSPINKIKRVFTISLYFNDDEVASHGGRNALKDKLLKEKRILSAKYNDPA